MHFDQFTVVLLMLRTDAPQLDPEAAEALQDAHLAHLAHLHDTGKLVAAGPLGDDHFHGLSILNVDIEEARRLKEADPAVVAGRFALHFMRWMVPAGAVAFTPTHFPRSSAEARDRG